MIDETVVILEMSTDKEEKEIQVLLGILSSQIKLHPDLIQWTFGDEDETLLHLASRFFRDRAAGMLLQFGANPNARTNLGGVPLFCIFGDMEENAFAIRTAEVLLDHGADPNATTLDGESLVYRAILGGAYEEIAALLLRRGAKHDIKSATLRALPGEIEKILSQAPDPVVMLQNTPNLGDDIFRSKSYQDPDAGEPVESLRLLLANGLSPNLPVPARNKPLIAMLAMESWKTDLARVLIEFGCDVNPVVSVDGRKRTPLDLAKRCKNSECVELLQAAGAKSYAELYPSKKRGGKDKM